MTISVIIVNYKTPHAQKRLVAGLKDPSLEVIVIDNSEINRGYGMAGNRGALQAQGDWLLFLNPDVEITADQILKMAKEAENGRFDAVSPRVGEEYRKPLPTPWSLMVEFTPLNNFFRHARFLASLGMTGGGKKTLFGGCLLIKRTVFIKIGGWDERFFIWFEDSDLTKRLYQNKYSIGWSDIKVKHSGGESFKEFDEIWQRDVFFHSMDVYSRKYFGRMSRWIVSKLKKRYSQRKLLPTISDRISLTVPNMKLELLEKFLKKNLAKINDSHEWIIVSSSVMPSVWEMRKKYPEIRFIPIVENRGFATTVNLGFRVATGKWLGTINDDTSFDEDWVNDSLKCGNSQTGSINPVIYNGVGQVETAGIKILKNGRAEPLRAINHEDCFEVEATNAAAVIYSREALNKVGLYDERFGSYLEDIDLALRLRRAGYKNLVSPRAKVEHIGQQSSVSLGAKKQFMDFRNWILVILKNWSFKDKIVYAPSIIIERLRNLSGLLKNII